MSYTVYVRTPELIAASGAAEAAFEEMRVRWPDHHDWNGDDPLCVRYREADERSALLYDSGVREDFNVHGMAVLRAAMRATGMLVPDGSARRGIPEARVAGNGPVISAAEAADALAVFASDPRNPALALTAFHASGYFGTLEETFWPRWLAILARGAAAEGLEMG